MTGHQYGRIDGIDSPLKECLFYKKESKDNNSAIDCELCPHLCRIDESKTGICKTRINIKGVLRSLNYEKLTSIALDPIEKKPLFHFHPGKLTLSAGSFGCNLKCLHCQNFEISNSEFSRYRVMDVAPETLILLAKDKGSEIISYTYNEPTVFYEFVLDSAILARKEGLKNVLVTNGFINREPLEKLSEYIDAANVDLKSFSDEFYKKVCFGRLNQVLENMIFLKNKGVHLEITYLIIPTMNDSEKEIDEACKWIHNNLGDDIPLHFSRFFPMFRMQNKPITPIDTLIKAREIAIKNNIKYCYIGNIHDNEDKKSSNASNTICPNCKRTIIERKGYDITIFQKEGSRLERRDSSGKIICTCGFEIYGKI